MLLSGIHSIERTAQEDMLLVLFNVAISNLVNCDLAHFFQKLALILVPGSLPE
jgi:hypothetical protein